MIRHTLALAAMLAMPAVAQAQVIRDCGRVGNPAAIVEPWAENTRSFANGAIRIALLDTGGEPACCSVHLLVLIPTPPQDGPVTRQCLVLSAEEEMGFFDIGFSGIGASYDPAQGLALDIPVFRFLDGIDSIPDHTRLRISQAHGTVVIEE